MSEPVLPPTVNEAPAPIVARAGRYYRNARLVMVLGLLIMGGYFAYDGYKGYPARNAEIARIGQELNATPKDSPRWIELEQQQRKLGAPKSDTDIGLQKVLGYALPVVALAYLAYFLNKSRGEIRLENDVLTAPGHPPVPLSAVTAVDTRLWKKKGIATLQYAVEGKRGSIVLDDFVYQQTPIDAMYDRVVAQTSSSTAT
ncbi:MAG TPA: hypothetical protein VF595_11410 [Tepidisphaeraceae bacterium]|jgi:hypothetical protein